MMKGVLGGAQMALEEIHIPFRLGYIIIASRNYGKESAIQTAKFAQRWREHIVGISILLDLTPSMLLTLLPLKSTTLLQSLLLWWR